MAGLKTSQMGLILVLVVILYCGGAAAQSGCTSAFLKLSPCLNFITGNSSAPSSSCCAQLASVVQTQPRCLCTALGGGTIFGITINQTRALELPGTCNVKTPPASQCNLAADGPAMSPAGSPASPPSSASPSDSTGGETPADQTPIIPSDPSSGPGSAVGPPSSNASPSRHSSLPLTIQALILVLSVLSFAGISHSI